MPKGSALDVYRAVMAMGKKWDITNAGYRAIDSLSCEKGYRHWHGDIRPDDTPLEAGLAFTCKLKTNTNFLGRAAVEHQRAEGITRKLVTLTLQDGTQPLWGLEAIVRDGQIVGYARRAEYAFALGRAIAYGYVQRPEGGPVNKEFLSSGTWHLQSMGETLPATVHIRPPFDPKNLRRVSTKTYQRGKVLWQPKGRDTSASFSRFDLVATFTEYYCDWTASH